MKKVVAGVAPAARRNQVSGVSLHAAPQAPSRGPRWGVTRIAAVAAALSLGGCSGSSSGSREAFCTTVTEVPVIRDVATLIEPQGSGALVELLDSLERLRRASPRPVRRDVDTLLAVTRDLSAALDDAAAGTVGPPLASLQQNLDDFAAASSRVVDYTSRSCGLDISR